MKSKFITFIALTMLALSGFVSCQEMVYPVAVLKFTLDKSYLKLGEGMETSLKVTVYPDNATNKDVVWTSSDTSVVQLIPDLDNDCVNLKALKKGVAQIKVNTITTYSKQYAYCDVVVTEYKPVDSLSFSSKSLTIVKGMTGDLIAYFHPEDASEKKVEWEWSGKGIAVFPDADSSAVVKGFATGKYWVYAYALNLGQKVGEAAKCEVDIIDSTHVTSVTLNKKLLELQDKGSDALSATVLPEDATDKDIVWESLDPEIVSVEPDAASPTATVNALTVGEARVVVYSVDGCLADTCLVKVDSLHVYDIKLNTTSLEIERGLSTPLLATILPEKATDHSVIWESSDDQKAIVVPDAEDSRNAILTAVDTGAVVIKATSVDGGYSVLCKVNVIEELPETVVLDLYFGDPSGVNPLGFGLGTPTIEEENAYFGETYQFLYKYQMGGVDKEKKVPVTVCRGTREPASATSKKSRYYYSSIPATDESYEGYILMCENVGEWFGLPAFGGRYLSEITVAIGNGWDKAFGLSADSTSPTALGSFTVAGGNKTAIGKKTVKFYANGNDGLTPATVTTEIATPYFLHITSINDTRMNRITMTFTKELPTR